MQINHFTLSISETVMGVSRKKQNPTGFEYAEAVIKLNEIIHKRSYKLWLYPDFLYKITNYAMKQVQLLKKIHSFSKNIIQSKKSAVQKGFRGTLAKSQIIMPKETKTEAKETKNLSFGPKDDLDVDDKFEVGEKERKPFLETLLQSAKLSDQDLKDQVDTFLFEGHDTTAAASSFFLLLMGIHQDIQVY